MSIVSADSPRFKDYHVKARYLNSFTEFINWPPDAFPEADQPLRLCVLGENPFEQALDILVHRHNANPKRKTDAQQVVYLRRGESASGCHLLYISDSEESYVLQLLSQLKGNLTLTVSSLKDFAVNGGMIQFYIRDHKVRFLIDLQTLRDEGLQADANLLRVADLVEKKD